ncbi:MAG TPA: GNAT family N-acetyltransferase [Rhodanobacteraceae bacterium]|nr:GNAT family N-acetyltransferase [Rhodanobacteraceae bacterium]
MPIQSDYFVEICDWAKQSEREALVAVREDVFVHEQHVPLDMEVDSDDPRSSHVLARALDGTPIATGRVTPDGVIGRMAVLRSWRQRGVGTTILHTLVDLARTGHLDAVTAHAQRQAVPFYSKQGFAVEGSEFEEAGIAHVKMRKSLERRAAPERAPLPPAPQPDILKASSREELITVTHELLRGARHSMCVLVRELHPQLLNDTACLVELRRLAISGRGASIRILAQDLTRALHEGTRLLELAQRLSSVIELRKPVEQQDLEYPSAFMCVDSQGYLFRPVEFHMAAEGSTWAPGRHALLMCKFEEVWARSEAWPELRALGI